MIQRYFSGLDMSKRNIDLEFLKELAESQLIDSMVSWVAMFEPVSGLHKLVVDDVEIIYSFMDAGMKRVHAIMLTHTLIDPVDDKLNKKQPVLTLEKEIKTRIEALHYTIHMNTSEGSILFMDRRISLDLTPVADIEETIRKYVLLLKKHGLLERNVHNELKEYLKI